MRLGWVVLVGCARPVPAPPVVAARPVVEATAPVFASCDVATWHERAAAPLLARIAGAEVAIVDEHDSRVRVIAELGVGLLVGAEVPERLLDRVVVREVEIAPGVFVQPGVAVDEAGAVETGAAIRATGKVPLAATGRRWERLGSVPDPAAVELTRETDVYAAPHVEGDGAASIRAGYRVVDRKDDLGNGWFAIAAHDATVRVAGFIHPVSRGPLTGAYDFSDDVIEGELVKPDTRLPRAAAGCLFARPDERSGVVGISDGSVVGNATGDGWVRVRVSAPWGRVVGYGRVALSSER